MEKLILEAAYRAWNDMASLRARRDRYKRFTYGDQWSDPVVENNEVMTAAECARRHGRRPMTNNLLRRLVKSVVGRYRYQRQEMDAPKGELAEMYGQNNLDELDCRSLEEFLISGCTIQRVAHERRLQGERLWVDMVSPDRFFVNRLSDPRGNDVEMVGMLHDWSLAETVVRLGGGDRQRASHIRRVYGSVMDGTVIPAISDLREGSRSFLSAPGGRCRVIEVWTLEVSERLRCHDTLKARYYTVPCSKGPGIDKMNAERRERGEGEIKMQWEAVPSWRCRWLAPDGSLLYSQVSERHPFHFRFYPMIDGEVHSLVEDVIDQQIYINELISLIDHVVSCAAKGVLLFPADEKLAGMTWQEVADMWSMPDALIPVKGRSASPPQQIIANGSNLGARELLATQMQMFEDISGVTNALMGKSQGGHIGAEQYESQVKNAIIAIADILETFGNFIAERDRNK